ncbi:hypothetical protein [Hymenobacter canadensis]|uniref:Uncharacterized protein n=1 Tax=Hymenobacter canadensis TaxID=2999067 RepID=A0ABY7LWA1_9BACT|nr:hypothetical protein [Hymenobacter canadensis]WBA44202.1 hypothetical protein O3303_20150 [Hymenobacter canadensis]
MKKINENGSVEWVIREDCDFAAFYRIAEQLHNEFKVFFLERVGDLDTLYWPFFYKGGEYVLHYNVYMGASIYPQNTIRATEREKAFLSDFDINWCN